MKEMKMNRINSSSLFHFTNGIEALRGILKKGFRYSYCYEDTTMLLFSIMNTKSMLHFSSVQTEQKGG